MQNMRRYGVLQVEAIAFALLVGIYLLLAVAYGMATPDLEAPDAGAHFRYVAFLHDHPQLPGYDLPTALVSHELVQQPPLYYALVAALLPGADVQATVAFEQDVQTPYFEKGLGKRATVSPPDTDPAIVWPLRVARGVSLAGGVLLVAATWVLARTLLRGRVALPLAITAVVAFNPQFIFTSTTITNDVWAAALSTLAVSAAALAATRHARWPAWLLVGALCGLATLAKYSGIVTLLPVALLTLLLHPPWNWHSLDATRAVIKDLLVKGLAVAVGFVAVTALQFGHNVAWTGELLPLQPIRLLLPGLIRSEPLGLGELWERLAFLTRSYTGIFGYGVRASAGFYEVIDLGLWLALAGAVVLVIRWLAWPRRGQIADLVRALALSLAWFVALLGSLAVWIRIMIAGEQGRLLFPAAAAVATLLVLGWIGWLPRRAQRWAAGALGVCTLALAVWQYQTVQNTYATPPAIAAPLAAEHVVDATFAGGMQLLGFDLPAGAATDFGKPLPLTLYFRADKPVHEDYTLFLHLVDGDNRMYYQYDGIPYQGRHPPRQWHVGEVFADSYEIFPRPETAAAFTETISATLASLTLGFYPVLQPAERLSVLDANGQPAGDRLQLAKIRILPPGERSPAAAGLRAAPLGRWQSGIELEEVAVMQEENGNPTSLQLRWGAEQIIRRDYTVFVQALDAAGNLVAQVDQQPQQGSAPTSTWLPGETIVDYVTFSQPLDGWQQIIVGLYDGSGQRLPLTGPVEADYVVVLQRPS
jgi:hypothetical protein